MSTPNATSPLIWNASLSMDIPEIDAEHQHFIILVNKLNEVIVARQAVEAVKYCMQSILFDAAKHFAHEEALFIQWGYPAAEEHARKHAEVTRALDGIMGHFGSGGFDDEWIEAGLLVKEALIAHMLDEDVKYRDFCRARGIRFGTDAARKK